MVLHVGPRRRHRTVPRWHFTPTVRAAAHCSAPRSLFRLTWPPSSPLPSRSARRLPSAEPRLSRRRPSPRRWSAPPRAPRSPMVRSRSPSRARASSVPRDAPHLSRPPLPPRDLPQSRRPPPSPPSPSPPPPPPTPPSSARCAFHRASDFGGTIRHLLDRRAGSNADAQGEAPTTAICPISPHLNPHLNHPASQVLFAIFDTIDKAADKAESGGARPPHRRGNLLAGGNPGAVTPRPSSSAPPSPPSRSARLVSATPKEPWASSPTTRRPRLDRRRRPSHLRRGGRHQGAGHRRRTSRRCTARRAPSPRTFASSSVAPAITDFGAPLHRVAHRTRRGGGRRGRRVTPRARASRCVVGGAIRGYAGFVRPVEAYDEVLSGGNIVVVDVRSAASTPSAVRRCGRHRRAANKYKSVPREKLQGNFKNMGYLEATLTATGKVASPHGATRGTKVLVLDNCACGDATRRWPRRSRRPGLREGVRGGGWLRRLGQRAGVLPPPPSERRRRGRRHVPKKNGRIWV